MPSLLQRQLPSRTMSFGSYVSRWKVTSSQLQEAIEFTAFLIQITLKFGQHVISCRTVSREQRALGVNRPCMRRRLADVHPLFCSIGSRLASPRELSIRSAVQSLFKGHPSPLFMIPGGPRVQVLGRLTPSQITWLLALEVPFYVVNQWLAFAVFRCVLVCTDPSQRLAPVLPSAVCVRMRGGQVGTGWNSSAGDWLKSASAARLTRIPRAPFRSVPVHPAALRAAAARLGRARLGPVYATMPLTTSIAGQRTTRATARLCRMGCKGAS